MEWLRAEYTEVWVPGAVVPLVRFADKAAAIASTGLDLFGVGDLAPDDRLLTRLGGFDSIVSWYGANRVEFRAATARHKLAFRFLPALPPAGCRSHATDFFASQVGAPQGLKPRLEVGKVERRDSIVIQPFSGGTKKNWPIEKYRELVRELPLGAEWLAGPEEELDGAQRFDDLWQAAQWIAGARLYLGNDSGITHLAAATGVPVVALFGPTDPTIWGPRGNNVMIMRWEPIRALPVSACLQVVRRALKSAWGSSAESAGAPL
jgi:hypothetical protein